jgi:hypothetical protein
MMQVHEPISKYFDNPLYSAQSFENSTNDTIPSPSSSVTNPHDYDELDYTSHVNPQRELYFSQYSHNQ